MKTLRFLLVGAVALMAFAGCSDDVEEPVVPNKEDNQNQGNNQEQEQEYDETYYAEHASISCSDPKFTVTDDGVTVSFKVSGGEITIAVDCGTEWTAQNSAEDIFGCSKDSTSVTITAEQNLVEEELTGIIKLVTMPSQIEFATITVTQDAYGSPEISVDTNEWHAPAIGDGLTTTIGVEATGEWSVENNAEWLTVEKTETGLNLAVVENNENAERVAEVVLTCADEFNSDSETIKVTQDGLAYITLEEEELLLSSFGSTKSVAVESNFDWDYSYDTFNGWFAIEKGEEESTVTITYDANETGADREGVVTFTAGDGAANVAEAELKITQSWENTDAIIFEYTITDNNVRLTLPINDFTNVTIDWDDGNTENTSTYYPSHTYITPGIYNIIINGDVKSLCGGTKYLTAVKQWGNTGLTSMLHAFYNCTNLKTLPAETGDALANVTTFRDAFSECSSLESIPSDLFSKCSKAEDFRYCFFQCSSLSSVPEDLFATCTLATTFDHCFAECYSLISVPSFKDLSKVTSFNGCFGGCVSLTTLTENMFAGCLAVSNFHNSFVGCYNLTAVPEDIFASCSAVTDFGYVFSGCYSLKNVPVSIFDNSFLVTDFSYAFYYCPLEGESPYTEMEMNGEKVKIHLYERGNYAANMRWANPSGLYCFRGCTNLADYDEIPSEWR